MLNRLQELRSLVLLVLGGFFAVFVLQNLATVELNFLIWSFQSRRIIVIAVGLVIGLVIGWLYGYHAGRKWRDSEGLKR